MKRWIELLFDRKSEDINSAEPQAMLLLFVMFDEVAYAAWAMARRGASWTSTEIRVSYTLASQQSMGAVLTDLANGGSP